MMIPHVMAAVVDQQGNTIRTNGELRKHNPISPETAETMSRILEMVVEKGTGKRARLHDYRVAGKTGTAQKYDSHAGAYSSSKVVVSFLGFAPVEHPRLTMLVLVDEPQIGKWGGEIAAPVFRKVAERVLSYLGVLPGSAQVIRTAAAFSKTESLTVVQ